MKFHKWNGYSWGRVVVLNDNNKGLNGNNNLNNNGRSVGIVKLAKLGYSLLCIILILLKDVA